MKKKTNLSVLLSLVLCFMMFSSVAFAAQPDPPIAPMAQVSVDFGLIKEGGSTYAIWGFVSTPVPESLRITVSLYENTSSGQKFVTSDQESSTNASSLNVSKSVTLKAGSSYTVYVSASGNTQSYSNSKTYYI